MRSNLHNIAFSVAILGATLSLACTPALSYAGPTFCQEKETKLKEEKAKVAADTEAAQEAFASLAKLMKKKDYASASKLMTKDGFDEFCSSRIIEAGMMADQQFAPAATADKVQDVLDKYEIDISDMPDMFNDEMPTAEEQREMNKELLSGFKSMEQRLEAIKELEKAMEPEGDAQSMIITISPFDGKIVSSNIKDGVATLEVEPSLPEGMGMMMGGPDGELPEGVEIFEADELPPGAMQADGFPMDEIPEGAEMQDMMFGGIPSLFSRLKKEGNDWKWDGFDMEKMQANQGEMGMDFNIPTIEDPKFTGTSLSGDKVSLEDYRGKLVLVDFWGTWCKPCVAELPKLKKIYEALKDHGFEIVGVANDSKKDLAKFMKKRELPWTNIVDDKGKICEEFGIHAFPTTLLIDQEGNHVASNLHGKSLVKELAERLKLNDEDKAVLEKAIKPKRKRSKKAQF